MSGSRLTGQGVYGLFELNPAGIVLYSRVEQEEEPCDVVGRNFYEEVAPFSNVEEFRLHVTQFARGTSHAESFNFDCQCDGGPLPVRVLLARICERTRYDRTKSVLVHITKGA